MEEKKDNIFTKMLKITSEISRVNKNLDVGIGKNSYKAVGEADILKAVKELENKYGIYSYPFKREIVDKDILQTKKEYNGQVTEGNQFFMRLEITYRFVNTEEPSEFLDIISYGDGIDTQDKAPGKAMTYGDKYALMKAYKIITGEDPDQNPSPEKVTYKENSLNKQNPVKNDDVLDKRFTSGKHAGEKYIEVCSTDMNYIDWLINSKNSEIAKKAKEEFENAHITI